MRLTTVSASSTPGYSNAVNQLLQQKYFTHYAITTAGKLGHCPSSRTSPKKLLMNKRPRITEKW